MITLSKKEKLKYFAYSRKNISGIILLIIAIYYGIGIYNDIDFLALQIDDDSPTTTGVVEDIRYKGIGLNNKDYFEISFSYLDPINGERYHWKSYSDTYRTSKNAQVIIQYNEQNPTVAKIKGTDGTFYSSMKLTFTSVIFFISVLMFIAGTYTQKNKLKVLKTGVVTYGRHILIRPTDRTFRGKKIYKIKFQYAIKSGKTFESIISTHRLNEVTDEKEELLVYNIDDPLLITLVDDFPTFLHKSIREQAEREMKLSNKIENLV